MISRIDIYNYIESKVNIVNRPVYCSARLENVPVEMPACYIVQIGEASIENAYTFDYTDSQVERDFEVHVYSNLTNGALYQAETIMADVRQAMRELYFMESFVGRSDDVDPSIIHLVGRFHRVIGGSDTMPT